MIEKGDATPSASSVVEKLVEALEEAKQYIGVFGVVSNETHIILKKAGAALLAARQALNAVQSDGR